MASQLTHQLTQLDWYHLSLSSVKAPASIMHRTPDQLGCQNGRTDIVVSSWDGRIMWDFESRMLVTRVDEVDPSFFPIRPHLDLFFVPIRYFDTIQPARQADGQADGQAVRTVMVNRQTDPSRMRSG